MLRRLAFLVLVANACSRFLVAEKMPSNLYFIMEGDASLCVVDDAHKVRTTVMSSSQLGTFGDFGKIVADAEDVMVSNTSVRGGRGAGNGNGSGGGGIKKQMSVKRQASSQFSKPNSFNKTFSLKKGLSQKLSTAR